MIRAGRSTLGVLPSTAARMSIAGPRVMSRKSRDGGYLVVLRNDNTVNSVVFCTDHRDGSPYTLIARRTTNAAIDPHPMRRSHRTRDSAGRSNSVPSENPTAVTPIHGMIGYAEKTT